VEYLHATVEFVLRCNTHTFQMHSFYFAYLIALVHLVQIQIYSCKANYTTGNTAQSQKITYPCFSLNIHHMNFFFFSNKVVDLYEMCILCHVLIFCMMSYF
jgi:hypothetical protein